MIENFSVKHVNRMRKDWRLYTLMKDRYRNCRNENPRAEKFYGVSSKEGLEFFEAHKSADVIHRAECEKLLDNLTEEEQKKAESSLLTARYLWNF